MKKFRSYSINDKIFYIITGFLLTAFFIIVLYPCIYVVSASFSSGSAVEAGRVILWPVDFSLEGYKAVFHTPSVWIGFRNSLFYTIAGTLINILVTMIAAYGLARPDLPGRNGIMLFFTFTMFFSGGMITGYMLVRSLHILNTIWAMLIPGALGVYNLIIARTFIESNIPTELLEAAQMDGCSDIRFFASIVLPLSKAVIAVLVLFYGVSHWNSYFNEMMYLSTNTKFPLQLVLREILVNMGTAGMTLDVTKQLEMQETKYLLQYSSIIVGSVPVMLLYPFVQKYFVKGIMVGAIKG